jgi:hypothetical protein
MQFDNEGNEGIIQECSPLRQKLVITTAPNSLVVFESLSFPTLYLL